MRGWRRECTMTLININVDRRSYMTLWELCLWYEVSKDIIPNDFVKERVLFVSNLQRIDLPT